MISPTFSTWSLLCEGLKERFMKILHFCHLLDFYTYLIFLQPSTSSNSPPVDPATTENLYRHYIAIQLCRRIDVKDEGKEFIFTLLDASHIIKEKLQTDARMQGRSISLKPGRPETSRMSTMRLIYLIFSKPERDSRLDDISRCRKL
ncbi:hypothetical protein RF11_01264 [Thelohanellus kitauei]|uniref:Uncharacterized protein n=1 Tax=Thelohanellus kitauei TaxID=669202 RepID=A0A0C2I5F4_THEKT|nr:hypothetical protein RF11_01264 [Thelohanellus kitauei]